MTKSSDPRLSAQDSWFKPHGRRRRRRKPAGLRRYLKYSMPLLVIVLFLATSWATLKVFLLDRRAKPKPGDGEANQTQEIAMLDAEPYAAGNVHVDSHSDHVAAAVGGQFTADPILDPKAVERTFSNRVAPATQTDLRQATNDARGTPASDSPSNLTADLVLDPQSVLNASHVSKKAAPPPSLAVEPATSAPPSRAAYLGDARTMFLRAGTLFQAGDLQAAETLCRQLHELVPSFQGVNNLLGEISARQGRLDAAVSCFGQALQEEPDNAVYHSNLGLALSRLGRNSQAEEHLRHAVQLEPRKPTLLLNLAWHLHKMKNFIEELKCLDRALAVDPANPQIERKRLLAMLALDRFDAVETILRTNLANDPRNLQSHLMMAVLEAHRGNAAGAVEWLQKAGTLTTRAALIETLDRTRDFDSVRDTPPYQKYLAGLKAID